MARHCLSRVGGFRRNYHGVSADRIGGNYRFGRPRIGRNRWFDVALPGLVAAMAAPTITLLTNKIDRRLLLIGFASLVMLSNLTVALASSFAMILTGRVLLGVSVGGCDRHHRVSTRLAAGSAGGGAIVDRVGILPAFLLGGTSSLGCAVLVLFSRPRGAPGNALH